MFNLLSQVASVLFKKGNFMEKSLVGPVHVRFSSPEEAINLYISIQFKFFIENLLYSHYEKRQ